MYHLNLGCCQGHVWVHGPMLARVCIDILLPPRAVWMPNVRSVTWVHVGVRGPWYSQGHTNLCGLHCYTALQCLSVIWVRATAEGHVWGLLQSGAVLMSEALVIIEGDVDAQGLGTCWCQGFHCCWGHADPSSLHCPLGAKVTSRSARCCGPSVGLCFYCAGSMLKLKAHVTTKDHTEAQVGVPTCSLVGG